MKKNAQPIYLLSPKLKWGVFKKLNDTLVKDDGPSPKNGTRILWELLRDGRVYCFFDPLVEYDMLVGTEIPKSRPIIVIKNATQKVGNRK